MMESFQDFTAVLPKIHPVSLFFGLAILQSKWYGKTQPTSHISILQGDKFWFFNFMLI